MEIASEKNEKILLRSILDKMQPLLIQEIKKGNNRAVLTLEEEQLPNTIFDGFSWIVLSKVQQGLRQHNYSLDIDNIACRHGLHYYNENGIAIKDQFQISLTLLNPKS